MKRSRFADGQTVKNVAEYHFRTTERAVEYHIIGVHIYCGLENINMLTFIFVFMLCMYVHFMVNPKHTR